jgi:hypothetical protein
MNPDMNNQIALALIEQRRRAAMQQPQQPQPQQQGPYAQRPMMPRAPVMGTPQPLGPQQQAPNAFQNSYNAVTNALAPEAEPYKGQGLKALFARLFGNKDSQGGAAP